MKFGQKWLSSIITYVIKGYNLKLFILMDVSVNTKRLYLYFFIY